jgi:hypothetical protein
LSWRKSPLSSSQTWPLADADLALVGECHNAMLPFHQRDGHRPSSAVIGGHRAPHCHSEQLPSVQTECSLVVVHWPLMQVVEVELELDIDDVELLEFEVPEFKVLELETSEL